jgi:two-component system KDP operon response regulator KdpE
MVDLAAHLVTFNGCKLDFTPTEAALLHTLVTYAGKVVSAKQLLRSVWGEEGGYQAQGLRVYMSHLRRKLEVAHGRIAIETTGALGYRLTLRSADRLNSDGEFVDGPMELHDRSLPNGTGQALA